MQTIHWRHINGHANADGVAIVNTSNELGTTVTAFGGFATPNIGSHSFEPEIPENDEDTDITGAEACGATPIAVTTWADDPGTDTRYGVIGFAAPRGVLLRCHVWWTEEEAA